MTAHVKGILIEYDYVDFVRVRKPFKLFCPITTIVISKLFNASFLLLFRCNDPTELESYASAIKCNACNQGWVLPFEPLNLKSSWQCESCKLFLSVDKAIQLDNRLVEELQRVNRKSLENLEKFHKTYQQVLHPSHAFLMQLKQWLFEGKKMNERVEFESCIDLKCID